jgi:hypothetical protein
MTTPIYFMRILSRAQYLTMKNKFSHLSLVIYLFPTSPIKLKLGLQIGGRLLIASHLGKLQVKLACFQFLHPTLSGQDHILTSAGDSLIDGSIYDFRDPLCGN